MDIFLVCDVAANSRFVQSTFSSTGSRDNQSAQEHRTNKVIIDMVLKMVFIFTVLVFVTVNVARQLVV